MIIERWYRTFKELLYEEDEPEDFEGLVASTQAAVYYYNYQRYHKSLGYMIPYEWYRGNPELIKKERQQKVIDARKRRCKVNMTMRNDSLSLNAENSFFCMKHYNNKNRIQANYTYI